MRLARFVVGFLSGRTQEFTIRARTMEQREGVIVAETTEGAALQVRRANVAYTLYGPEFEDP